MQKQNTKRVLHEPVLVDEVCEFLQIDKYAPLKIQARLIDATVGFGGHTKEFVKRGWEVLGIDADEEALKVTKQVLNDICPGENRGGEACPPHLLQKVGQYKLAYGNFKDIDEIARRNGFDKVNGILLDLGVSSPQLISKKRGFSFQEPSALLDMRIDSKRQSVTASDILNALGEGQLVEMFRETLNVKDATILAKNTVAQRSQGKIGKVDDFVQIINRSIKGKKQLHKATLPFLALRMAVNSELENLQKALPDAYGLLVEGGRMVIISFHSGEDKIVKDFYKSVQERGVGNVISSKPIVPKQGEIERNPRARSAKMRVIEKTGYEIQSE